MIPRCFRFRPRVGLILLALALGASVRAEGLNFTLSALNGSSVRLADFRGQWVIVNFWATWCTPCLLEMPELEAFYQTQRGRVAVIGVNFEELASGEIRPFVERLGITFPIALSGGKLIPGFPLKGLPTTFLVSPTGHLADTHLGTVSAALLTERLAELERNAGHPAKPQASQLTPEALSP